MAIATGTCIVIWITPGEISIAADSLLTFEDDSESEEHCKIIQCGPDLFFASSGVNRHEETAFYVHDICKKAASAGPTLLERITKLEGLMLPALRKTLNYIFANDRNYYEKKLRDKNFVDVVFFGIENGLPALYRTRFFHSETSQGIEIRPQTQDSSSISDTEPREICMGCYDVARLAYFESTHNPHSKPLPDPEKDPCAYVRAIVEWAAAHQKPVCDEPDAIGGPISVLRVDKAGHKWIERGVCKAQFAFSEDCLHS